MRYLTIPTLLLAGLVLANCSEGVGYGPRRGYDVGRVRQVPIHNPGQDMPGAYRCTVGGQTGWCVPNH